MVTVRLYGHLEQKFGREHAFAIGSPAEAFRALEANYPGFRHAFLTAPHYYIRADGDWRGDGPSLLMPVSRDLDIVPDVEGDAFIAAALVPTLISSFGLSATAASIAASVIVAVVTTALMVGISLLLAPKPKKDTGGEDKKEDSFLFSGTDATIGQGVPVPLIYGRCWCPPVVISAGLETGDEKINNTASGSGSGGGVWLGGGTGPWSQKK